MASTPAPVVSLSSQFYRALLALYPRHFREEYEREMVIVFRDSMREAHRSGNALSIFYCWLTALIDLIVTAAHEWFANKPGPGHYVQKIGIGLAAGMAGGAVAGLGARLSMRGVALAGGLQPGFTIEGTLVIVVIGLVMGAPFGVAFMALRTLLPGAGIWKGIVYGLLVFVIFMAPSLLFYREGEFLLASPFVGLGLFAPLAFAYGSTVALGAQRLERGLSPTAAISTRRSDVRWASVAGHVITLMVFMALLELGVLGITSIVNHVPSIPFSIVRAARAVHIPFTVVRDSNRWLTNLTALGYFGISALIFWGRSRRPMARFTALALFLFGGAVFNTGAEYYAQLMEPETIRPFFNLVEVLGVTSLLALLYLFPGGRFVSAWTRPLALVWLAFAALWLLRPLPEPLTFAVIIAFLCSGLAAQVQRYCIAAPGERPQLRSPLIGFTVAILGFGLVAVAVLIVPDLKLSKVEGLAVAATFGVYMLPWLLIPITIGWAMRRHRLWAT